METMCQSASMCLLALRATNASRSAAAGSIFGWPCRWWRASWSSWWSITTSRFLENARCLGCFEKGAPLGPWFDMNKQWVLALKISSYIYIYLIIHNIINIYTYDTWCILSWVISMCPVPPRYKLVYRPHEHPCASSLQLIAHIAV